MARRTRSDILYDGCFAHVFSRSLGKRKIFAGSGDFEYFLSLLKQSRGIFKFKVYHYCLMHTHFHLAVEIPELENFSRAMQRVKWFYTKYFNKRRNRWGPLWRERFKSMLIENEEYLYACGRYIEQNPVKAGLVDDETRWPYSSARFYQNNETDELVERAVCRKLPDDSEFREEEFTRGWLIGSGWFKFKHLKGVS